MVASAIKRCQKRLSKENNSLILVLPYTVADMEYLEDFYDEIWIPDELHGVHFKNAITKRNEWFVNNSDLLIAYVLRDKGGAATCLKMAEKQDYEEFYEQEIKMRYMLGNPPFVKLVNIIFSSEDAAAAEDAAKKVPLL